MAKDKLHVVPENNKTTTTIQTRSEEKLKEAKVKANVSVVKSDSPVETIADISASYDLLILGTPEKDFKKCCTIGLKFCKQIGGITINPARGGFGTNFQICDRIDLTLECIRQLVQKKTALYYYSAQTFFDLIWLRLNCFFLFQTL